MSCPDCEGKNRNCPACGGKGHTLVADCPKKTIPPDIFRFLELYDFAEKGTFPVAGGLLDQTQAFVDAVRFMRGEDMRWKKSLMPKR